MFHPRLVKKLVEKYTTPGDWVLDPFMGSGVVAVESSVTGRRFYGFDINPLALLITKVRATPLKDDILKSSLGEIIGKYSNIRPFK